MGAAPVQLDGLMTGAAEADDVRHVDAGQSVHDYLAFRPASEDGLAEGSTRITGWLVRRSGASL